MREKVGKDANCRGAENNIQDNVPISVGFALGRSQLGSTAPSIEKEGSTRNQRERRPSFRFISIKLLLFFLISSKVAYFRFIVFLRTALYSVLCSF